MEEIFTRTCFWDFMANFRKCLFRKIKLRLENYQNKVKERLMDFKTMA